MRTDPCICPTVCDEDCEVNGWGCHEAHDVRSHWLHDPEACEARQTAGNLRHLVDAGWGVTVCLVPQGPRRLLEPYFVTLIRSSPVQGPWRGVNPGDALAKARKWAEDRSEEGAR